MKSKMRIKRGYKLIKINRKNYKTIKPIKFNNKLIKQTNDLNRYTLYIHKYLTNGISQYNYF